MRWEKERKGAFWRRGGERAYRRRKMKPTEEKGKSLAVKKEKRGGCSGGKGRNART